MAVEVRRIQQSLQEILHEGGPVAQVPRRVATAAAVVHNPFAGSYHEDIHLWMDELKPLGLALAERLLDRLTPYGEKVDGYGKGAIVGAAGELEHGALWHVPGGYAMRESMQNSHAIVPSTKIVASPSAHLAIPITHSDASYVRGHFDAVEVSVPGAPAADEMVLILVMSCGPRIHARVGGLAVSDVIGEDGLR